MKKRKNISSLLLATGIIISISFLLRIEFPQGFEVYFDREYYNQFGPLAIGIELIIASYHLLIAHKKANFTLALFGFTALLDPMFNKIGLFLSIVPLYGTIVLSTCAFVCLWIAFSNRFELKRLSSVELILSLILGIFIELFFNYI